ncbi:MAG TPA: flagellar biosynthetic protein FliO [Burkholderiaceae bacterium]|jgi:flagellar biogenesis protein FliO|nr:flagellar biosynthetic protein FliO [Burkholderiaceae bacterium]
MTLRKMLVAAFFLACGMFGFATHNAVAADEPAPSAPASQIPYKRDHISTDSDLPRVALGLTVCLLLLSGAVYFLRRRLGINLEVRCNKKLRVVESHRLNPRSSLYVVAFAGKYHLLGQSEHSINCLVSTPIESPPSLPEQT